MEKGRNGAGLMQRLCGGDSPAPRSKSNVLPRSREESNFLPATPVADEASMVPV